eukprot:TRINITY_DN4189_c0_g1_i1.p1 TRINITY_DN4189_c0_g1~~TRINITY_DN4189_c0_g1_i1.p1  ORF type:complete len:562 (-),score=115.93 TRINITY_DN4189_c0_g1_i1:86-1771(-)
MMEMMKKKIVVMLLAYHICIVHCNLAGDLFGKIVGNNLEKDPNNDCAACTVIVAILEQYAQVHNKSADEVVSKACDFLPQKLEVPCQAAVLLYGPSVIKFLENDETPDDVCLGLGFCKNQTCNIFPKRHTSSSSSYTHHIQEISSVDNMPSFVWPWTEVADHLPAVDVDHDRFGEMQTLRGTHWRGKDCNDLEDTIYPGRRVNNFGDKIDHNCNGIFGTDENGNAYEDLLCSDTDQLGYILLGDSAGAHFHIPPQWMTASMIDNTTYKDMIEILEDEMDWPEQSGSTGYMNESYSGRPVGPVQSYYLQMRSRNLCMHRDYQNIALNGCRSSSMARDLIKTMARSQIYDQPVSLAYSLIGNDVCNGHYGTSHMTTQSEFYENVVTAMKYLDTMLPNGSHVSFIGLVDGRILYDSMSERYHPLGQLNQDVTYSSFYDYMNCLEISPCFGWMNSDEYWRNVTTERAMQLNEVYGWVIANNTFNNFDMTYFDTPLVEAKAKWEASGGQMWQLIEPVDGFHPNQYANALIATLIYDNVLANFSHLLPPINPNNAKIAELFGDQGGY